MAKVTKGRGPSFTREELSDPSPPVLVRRAELGRVDQLAGTDSSEPSSNESQSNERETVSPQEHVPTMENPSVQTDAEDSTVDLTGGVGQTETVKPYDEWTVAELKEELSNRDLSVSGNKGDLVSRLEENDLESQEDSDEFD